MKTVYQADDGTIHASIHECIAHESELARKANESYERYITTTYFGKKLLERHSLFEEGMWQVYGEDPNCDFGGHHYNPYLGTYTGTLEDVIRKAVNLAGFWQWGGGGRIVKVGVVAV